MQTIFGSGLATGKFAMGSNEALGDPSEFVDTYAKDEPIDVETFCNGETQGLSKNKNKSQPKDAASVSGGYKKRKRSVLSEEETIVFTGMIEAVNNVAAAIRETAVHEVHPELYDTVMNMTGFPEEVLFVAFSYLVDNKAQGAAFVVMNENHRVMWLNSFRAKHNI